MASARFSSSALILILVFLSNSSLLQPTALPPPQHFILSLQWAFTVCQNRPLCLSPKFRTDFTVHGLWSEPEPKPCTGPIPYVYQLIDSATKHRLESNWLDAERNNNQFLWKHEYETHGVCIKFGNTMANTLTYLKKGLEAYGTLPQTLGQFTKQIFNGQAVPEGTIYAGLQTYLQNKDFAMICNTNSELQEIRVYLRYQEGVAKDWSLEDMPAKYMKSCSGSITLPVS